MNQSPKPESGPVVQAVPKWFLTLASIPILLGLLWFGSGFLVPIAVAALLYILNMALVDRLDSAKFGGRSIPRWLAYIGATAFIFLGVFGLGYILSNQAAAVGEAAPRYMERIAQLRTEIESFVGSDRILAVERAIEEADTTAFLTSFAASASGIVGNVGLILLYLAFMLAERGAFAEKLPRLCETPEDASHLENSLRSISNAVQQYMWINTVTSAMSATLAFVVLKLLGVDFAALLALSVFFLNFIPSIGSFLAMLFPTVVALLQFDTMTPALIVIVVYGGGDAIIGNVVQPRMQGKSLNLSTLIVMIALTFWSIMWGGVGAFMAVPLTVVIMIICSQFEGTRPFARLLSSDGRLPQDDEEDPKQDAAAEEEATPPGKPLDQPEAKSV